MYWDCCTAKNTAQVAVVNIQSREARWTQPFTLGSFSKDVFSDSRQPEIGLFPKFVLLSKGLYSYRDELPENLARPLCKNAKRSLTVDMRFSKTSFIKLPIAEKCSSAGRLNEIQCNLVVKLRIRVCFNPLNLTLPSYLFRSHTLICAARG